MVVIGLTGGSGAGKSTALQILAEMGACVIDCDQVYHQLLAAGGPMLDQLAGRFPGVVTDGELDRRALGQIVFHDPQALADLNEITHGYVRDEVQQRMADWAAQGGAYVAIDAVALIESGIADWCTAVVGIIAPMERRIERICRREGIDPADARTRIMSQKPDSFFQEHCDYILDNQYPCVEEFTQVCRALFQRIMN
ncbi:MAG: dephospho-CoA kinase [Oscillospiraceae bacterium]|nr:dephospho-CoA kinase [Oscillospiraceae bacterium]